MNHLAVLRTPRGIAAVAVLALAVVVGVFLATRGGDETAPRASPTATTAAPSTAAPSESAPEPTPTPTPSAAPSGAPTCEGPDTAFNREGIEQPSLLPDCGTNPVTQGEEDRAGLGLACGGDYPVILYKTTTASSKSSICGVNSSGEKLRVVVAPDGASPKDLEGSYEYQLDAFVAKDGDTTYTIQAYDGTLLISRDGSTTTQTSDDWISLDNESDYD